ncbi:MAG: YigZ family protein [Bacillota bacterium]
MFKTIKEPIKSQFKVKKSKFIGYLFPVDNENMANKYIEKIKKKHYDATHNVPVYLIGEDKNIQKYSDDGEPSGTAGLPILELLKNENITNIVVVVTRYFGGTKLGTGGLVRAYTKSVKLALKKAKILENKKYIFTSFSINYTIYGKIKNFISKNDYIILKDSDFTDVVTIKMFIIPQKFDKIKEEIKNMTNGDVVLKQLESKNLIV